MRYILLLVVCTCPAFAQQEVALGTFNAKGYNAEYVATQIGKTSFYWEHERELKYDLGIVTYPISNKLALVARIEDPNWLRVGLKFGFGGGSSRTTVVALPGNGDAPTWFDVFTPALPVVKNVTLDGWLRLREGGKPVLWVGPTIKAGKAKLWFREDLNGGTWVGGVDLPPLKF